MLSLNVWAGLVLAGPIRVASKLRLVVGRGMAARRHAEAAWTTVGCDATYMHECNASRDRALAITVAMAVGSGDHPDL